MLISILSLSELLADQKFPHRQNFPVRLDSLLFLTNKQVQFSDAQSPGKQPVLMPISTKGL